MLNLNDPQIRAILTKPMSAPEARQQISANFQANNEQQQNDPLWMNNDTAAVSLRTSYTQLLADKLKQVLTESTALSPDFTKRLWFNATTSDTKHSRLTATLVSPDGNKPLFDVIDPLEGFATLKAINLPTLLQITANDDDAVDFSPEELQALSALTKLFNQAGYEFAKVDETVLQPVDGLTFASRFDTAAPLTAQKTVAAVGDFTISVPLTSQDHVIAYQLTDPEGHDWKDLGSEEVSVDAFTWASTTIPEDLIDAPLTLRVTISAGASSAALDELFVIASNHAILMRQSQQENVYELPLPNQKLFTVKIDPAQHAIQLGYPDPETQIIELNHLYPFVGEWLKLAMPQKRAFN